VVDGAPAGAKSGRNVEATVDGHCGHRCLLDESLSIAAAAAQDGSDRGVERAADGDEVAAGEMPDGPECGSHECFTSHARDPASRYANGSVFPSGVANGSVYPRVCFPPRYPSMS